MDQFLFVYGDKPTAGGRTSELTVRAMLEEGRNYQPARSPDTRPMRFGAAAGLGTLPAWKRQADFLFVQVGFSLEPLLRWRERTEISIPVYAGVMALASPAMARNLAASIPDIDIPDALVERLTSAPTPASPRPAIRF